MVENTPLEAWYRVTKSLCLPYMIWIGLHMNQCVRITPFWTGHLRTFSIVLDSVLTDSQLPKLNASFDEVDALHFQSLQCFYTQLVPFLINQDHSFLLASNLIIYGARLGHYFYLYHREVKGQPLSLFITFPGIKWHLDSRPFCHLLLYTITLNPANQGMDHSLSDFQTGIGAAVHATLDTVQLISHTRATLGDTIASLQGSNKAVIAASEVHALLSKIHDILDSVLSKWDHNMAHILTYLFNSLSSQYPEVWASQFLFLHNILDIFLLVILALMVAATGTGSPLILSWIFSVFNIYDGYQGQAKCLIEV